MGLRSLVVMKLIILVTFILAVTATVGVAALAKPNCKSRCGNVTIPYPFGTGGDCNITKDFFIKCDDTNYDHPKPFKGTVEVLDISLDGQLRILMGVTFDCYNSSGRASYSWQSLQSAKLHINNTKNKFTAIGCDTYALVKGYTGPKDSVNRKGYATGCLSTCNNVSDVIDGSCSGIGCCQTSIPKGVRRYNISLSTYYNHSFVLAENPCSYAFVAEDGNYTFSNSDLRGYEFQERKFPVILDWTIRNISCNEAKKNSSNFACKENSTCFDSEYGGYLCKCFDGFEGNPYLPNGCQDKNECETLRPCTASDRCVNIPGSYICSCPKGYEGDGKIRGTGCYKKRSTIIVVALGLYICRHIALFFN